MRKNFVNSLCGAGLLLIGSSLATAQNAAPAPPVVPTPGVVVQPGQSAAAQPQAYRAKQIIGSKVMLTGDVAAGTVDDIVLDNNGSVEYLIVMNQDKLVTVPWDATAFNFEKQLATVKIAPDAFQKIPTYTAERYPVFFEPQYRTTIYRSYGLTPRERRFERRVSR